MPPGARAATRPTRSRARARLPGGTAHGPPPRQRAGRRAPWNGRRRPSGGPPRGGRRGWPRTSPRSRAACSCRAPGHAGDAEPVAVGERELTAVRVGAARGALGQDREAVERDPRPAAPRQCEERGDLVAGRGGRATAEDLVGRGEVRARAGRTGPSSTAGCSRATASAGRRPARTPARTSRPIRRRSSSTRRAREGLGDGRPFRVADRGRAGAAGGRLRRIRELGERPAPDDVTEARPQRVEPEKVRHRATGVAGTADRRAGWSPIQRRTSADQAFPGRSRSGSILTRR